MVIYIRYQKIKTLTQCPQWIGPLPPHLPSACPSNPIMCLCPQSKNSWKWRKTQKQHGISCEHSGDNVIELMHLFFCVWRWLICHEELMVCNKLPWRTEALPRRRGGWNGSRGRIRERIRFTEPDVWRNLRGNLFGWNKVGHKKASYVCSLNVTLQQKQLAVVLLYSAAGSTLDTTNKSLLSYVNQLM